MAYMFAKLINLHHTLPECLVGVGIIFSFFIHVMYKVRNDMGPYMHVMWVASFHYCSDGFSSGLITSSALLIKLHMANGSLLDNCVVMIRYCISV